MIVYTESLDGITPEQLHGFFVGWPDRPTPERHLDLLRSSAEIVLAVDTDAARVVGFITAISDGVLAAFIPLLEVLPAYQGQGIGSELVRRMFEKLVHLYAVDLICDASLQPFYARFGMQPYTGMIRRRYERQAGRKE